MQLVTFPAYGTATAVWHCLRLHLCQVSSVKKLLSAGNKKRKKGISRVKEKILRTMENSPHLLPAKHRKQRWSCDQFFQFLLHNISSDILAAAFNNVVKINYCFLKNKIQSNLWQKPRKKKSQVFQEPMCTIQQSMGIYPN